MWRPLAGRREQRRPLATQADIATCTWCSKTAQQEHPCRIPPRAWAGGLREESALRGRGSLCQGRPVAHRNLQSLMSLLSRHTHSCGPAASSMCRYWNSMATVASPRPGSACRPASVSVTSTSNSANPLLFSDSPPPTPATQTASASHGPPPSPSAAARRTWRRAHQRGSNGAALHILPTPAPPVCHARALCPGTPRGSADMHSMHERCAAGKPAAEAHRRRWRLPICGLSGRTAATRGPRGRGGATSTHPPSCGTGPALEAAAT